MNKSSLNECLFGRIFSHDSLCNIRLTDQNDRKHLVLHRSQTIAWQLLIDDRLSFPAYIAPLMPLRFRIVTRCIWSCMAVFINALDQRQSEDSREGLICSWKGNILIFVNLF